uniref:Uncharacterized protein n=1 Tax=Salmo trutta TaxID=8032 RepID=A0A673Z6G8_SALTR
SQGGNKASSQTTRNSKPGGKQSLGPDHTEQQARGETKPRARPHGTASQGGNKASGQTTRPQGTASQGGNKASGQTTRYSKPGGKQSLGPDHKVQQARGETKPRARPQGTASQGGNKASGQTTRYSKPGGETKPWARPHRTASQGGNKASGQTTRNSKPGGKQFLRQDHKVQQARGETKPHGTNSKPGGKQTRGETKPRDKPQGTASQGGNKASGQTTRYCKPGGKQSLGPDHTEQQARGKQRAKGNEKSQSQQSPGTLLAHTKFSPAPRGREGTGKRERKRESKRGKGFYRSPKKGILLLREYLLRPVLSLCYSKHKEVIPRHGTVVNVEGLQ